MKTCDIKTLTTALTGTREDHHPNTILFPMNSHESSDL